MQTLTFDWDFRLGCSKSPSDSYRNSMPGRGPSDQPPEYGSYPGNGGGGGSNSTSNNSNSRPSHAYPPSSARDADHSPPMQQGALRRGTSVDKHAYPSPSPSHSSDPRPALESDQHYYKNMFREMGYAEGMEAQPQPPSTSSFGPPRVSSPAYGGKSANGTGAPPPPSSTSNSGGGPAGLLPPLTIGTAGQGRGGKPPQYGHHDERGPHPHPHPRPNVYGYNAEHGSHQQPYGSSLSNYPPPPGR